MRNFKEPGHCLHSDSLAVDWGECVRYIEIGDDRYAARQVEVYSDHRVLRYDRSHWYDRFGQLFGCRFSHKLKAIHGRGRAEVIEAEEFERAWIAALSSPLWGEQVSQSLVAQYGPVPRWLRHA